MNGSFLAKKLAIYLPAICIFVCLSAPSELHTLKNHQIIAKIFEKRLENPTYLCYPKKRQIGGLKNLLIFKKFQIYLAWKYNMNDKHKVCNHCEIET